MIPEPNLPLLFLKPGELVVTERPLVVTTLLGSCVAVTMYCPRLHLGGICHSLLPSCRKEEPCAFGNGGSGKYVECAIRVLFQEFAARGAARSEIQVKLFGGSDMFDTHSGKGQSVGKQNMEMAQTLLAGLSVPVATQDLGGHRGRKIVFHPHTGEVFLKRLKKSEI